MISSFLQWILCIILLTTNWHLPRALPRTEQQRHLPSASREIEPPAAVAADFQQSLREFRWSKALCAPGNLVGQDFRQMFLGTDFTILILASPHIWGSTKSLHSDIIPSGLTKTFCKLSASWYWTPPSPKLHILTFAHCHFGAVSQSYLRCYLLGCSPHFAPGKT